MVRLLTDLVEEVDPLMELAVVEEMAAVAVVVLVLLVVMHIHPLVHQLVED